MKSLIAIGFLTLTLTLTSSALTAEFPIVASGDETHTEHVVTAVRYTNSLGQVAQAWREYDVWERQVQTVNMWGVTNWEPKRRWTLKITDGKGGVFDERLFMNPVGPLVQLPEPPPVVVVNTCYDRSYSPYYWGGGGGMYNSGGMWNPAGGYTGGMYSSGDMSSGGSWMSGGMNSVGASAYASGQATSGLARQSGQSGNVSTTWVGGEMQVGGGSVNYGRNSADARFFNAGASVSARVRVGEPPLRVHRVLTTPGSKVEVYRVR